PYSRDIQTAPWLIEVQPRAVDEFLNDYGKRVDPEVEPMNDLPPIHEDMDDPRGRAVVYGTNLGGTATSTFYPSDIGVGPGGRGKAVAFQKELWIRDPSTQTKYWIEPTKNGPEMRYGKDLAYPNGRVISWANGVLLYDRPAPYLDSGITWPYVRFI